MGWRVGDHALPHAAGGHTDGRVPRWLRRQEQSGSKISCADDLTDFKLARLEQATQLVSMPMVSYQLRLTAHRRPDGARLPEPRLPPEAVEAAQEGILCHLPEVDSRP